MASLSIEAMRGDAAAALVEGLADLRIAVFREWPYLYEGGHAYERKYLQTYLDCPDSLIVVVRDGDRCVGASTALPLRDAEPEMQAPFRQRGLDIDAIDYFGESVVLPEWRGRGLGVKFFELREAHARELGLQQCTFCAVERSPDHPARPAQYQPNDAFWRRRGYEKVAGLQCRYDWPDIGETAASSKPMQFWMKTLA